MKLRITRPAAAQLDRVLTYIDQRNPQGARHVQHRVQAAIDLLLHHPFAGTVTARPGIRRLVVRPYPYAITYRVRADEVVLLGFRHSARRSHV
ncbi:MULTISPECIES: type II toxin-antitoxin system RelE/ParE family toxin [unclassified Methylobacterium]|uniref:type II toxin-antitoxin system RelE/ParE family toxin n=1 Tax=unclassified Methylobacterium TaxID=2615210 RepID=UPI001352FB8B|nr:type II toxin-antitoxin system RelE/ParE family toxin [Methylobacterium sp. 2A]